ncbi:MAG: FAD-dependent oxidoreductase [Chloroflexi bacterium]|nr:FAD-dependent oxidoreductase [Chloroflexota bacterium]
MKFAKLFEPCKIGTLEIANRIVMPPMTTNFPKDGYATDCMIDYYEERAAGGAGMIVVEDAIVESPRGHHIMEPLLIDDDKYLPRLRRLARTIQAAGSKAALNISHGGRRGGRAENGQLLVTRGMLPVAPSSLAHPVPGYVVPLELTVEEIEEIQEKYAQAAYRVRDAGFDLLCLHGAHMYLISEFLSPLSNQRTDAYGGDFDRRMRFVLEIIAKVKKKIGSDFPLMIRLNGEEPMEGGLKLEDTAKIARSLQEAGVDCISLSIGASAVLPRRDFKMPVAPMRFPRGCNVYMAEAVKKAVSVPVMTSNRIVTPQEADDILAQNRADIIGLGRALIADSYWPRKAIEGREDEIRCCIACMHCVGTIFTRNDLRCSVNAAAGQEADCKITASPEPKTVFVAGGGPAGMEAARVAALRGHKVRLFEKSELGGQLNLASLPPGKAEMKVFLDYLKKQMTDLGVAVERRDLTADMVTQARPDAVVVAAGASPKTPPIKGIDAKNVVTAWQVLRGDAVTKGRVVVLGGGQVGAETAEYLAEKGSPVTIIEMLERVADDMENISRQLLIYSLEDSGVRMLTRATVKEITESGVIIDRRGRQETIEADSIVLALGAQPVRELASQIEKDGARVYLAGDCARVGRLPDAVEGGYKAALKI